MMKDHQRFNLDDLNPMEIGRHLSEIYEEYGVGGALMFVDRYAANLAIQVIDEDKDNGYSAEHIHNKLKAYVMYCGLVYEVSKLEDDD